MQIFGFHSPQYLNDTVMRIIRKYWNQWHINYAKLFVRQQKITHQTLTYIFSLLVFSAITLSSSYSYVGIWKEFKHKFRENYSLFLWFWIVLLALHKYYLTNKLFEQKSGPLTHLPWYHPQCRVHLNSFWQWNKYLNRNYVCTNHFLRSFQSSEWANLGNIRSHKDETNHS